MKPTQIGVQSLNHNFNLLFPIIFYWMMRLSSDNIEKKMTSTMKPSYICR